MKMLATLGMTIALAIASYSPSKAEDYQHLGLFSGELDPSLEFEVKGKPTHEQCRRLGWTRGAHVEAHSTENPGRNEMDDFIKRCLAGQIPFTLNDVHSKKHRDLWLKNQNQGKH